MAHLANAQPVMRCPPLLCTIHYLIPVRRYDISLSLGFGRPHAMPIAACSRQYLTVARMLGPSAQVDLAAAAYAASLVELSTVSFSLLFLYWLADLPWQ